MIYTHYSYFFVCLFFFLQGLINLKNYDDRLYVNVDDLAVWASDFSYRKGWSNGYWSLMTLSFISLYLLHLAIFFLLIKQLFKTSCLTAKRGKVRLSYTLTYFYTFSLGKTNDFVITSLKAATQIPPPSPPSVIDFFNKFFYTNMYLTLNCPTNPHKRYFNVASAVPFVIFWNLADESLVVKRFLYWLRWASRATVIFFQPAIQPCVDGVHQEK